MELAAWDLPPVARRGEVSRPMQLGATVLPSSGTSSSIATPTTRSTARTARRRRPLQAGEYFVLGDNSGNSQDSRKWPRPGVPEADFVGKPFLIHQPLRTARVTVGGRGARLPDGGLVAPPLVALMR